MLIVGPVSAGTSIRFLLFLLDFILYPFSTHAFVGVLDNT